MAARSVTTETLPAVEETVADRFVVVGDLVERARIAFAESEASLTAVITSAGNLLPPTSPGS
ncbi:hypothetical protein BKN37_15540 [Mycobacterium talmoniae]|uniref:Uncharacterized protein n=1 Tax=Mycobacterium talmoniae TaxID=1858794 RepID=A0A1S1NHQ5_9MYCO|nr:hypothetical protein BKN37_15540 [Mycobacterium talmoniae]